MRANIIMTGIIAAMAMASCSDLLNSSNNQFTVGSDEAAYDAEAGTLTAGYERQQFLITVDAQSGTGKWTARCPTDDIWCSFSQNNNQLIITLDNNLTDDVRTSHITIVLKDNEKRIDISQDFYRYINLNLEDNTTTIGAAAGTSNIPFLSNVKVPIAVSTNAGWISSPTVTDRTLSFTVTRNTSAENTRSGVITLSAAGLEAQLTVVQNALSGYNYHIDLSGLDWTQSLVYEIYDPAHSNRKVGEICKEYLLKVNEQSLAVVVQKQAIVAYPCNSVEVADWQNGFVLDDGGRVVWNKAAAGGYAVMADYAAGALTAAPTEIFYPAGASIMTPTFAPEPDDTVYEASIRPLIVTDARSGATNTAGETTESFTYKVVKIGAQYWMAENLKTSRFRDGSNIPTNRSNAEWVSNKALPGCLVAASSSQPFNNANDPLGATIRNSYGCLYNFNAIIKQDVSATTALTNLTDEISPAGWGVPTRLEFELLVNYVLQGATDVTNGTLDELSEAGTGVLANITGFSARGVASRGVGTGGYNPGPYYFTMNYNYNSNPSSSQMYHNAVVIRIIPTSSGAIYNTAMRSGDGNYVRCIKK